MVRVVGFLSGLFLKLAVWLLYLNLNVPSVRPIYDSLLSSDLTVALYTIFSSRHFPERGQFWIPVLQLQSLLFSFEGWVKLITFLLWF